MSLLIDEYGRPIILFDSSDTKERLKGAEAYNVTIKIFLTKKKFYLKNIVKHFSSMWSSERLKKFFRTKRYGQNVNKQRR